MIPIKFSTSGPVALDLEPNVHQKKLNFLDVFARLVMEKQLLPANLKTKYNGKVPYGVYFPTLQEKVGDRTCRLCGQYFSVKISLVEHKRICKRNKELNVAHVVGEEDLLVEDIDDELDLVELGTLISIPQHGCRIPLEPAAKFQGGSEPAKTLILQQVLNCYKTPQI